MTIRLMQKSEIQNISRLHKKILPDTLSSRLGEKYLQELYENLLNHKSLHICLVAYDKKVPIGVLTVSKDLLMTQKLFSKQIFKSFLKVLKTLLLGRISPKTVLMRIYFERAIVSKFRSPYPTILTLFVSEKYQGQKVGTQLIDKVLQEFKKEKIKKLYTDTLIENKKAQAFYLKKGFKKKLKLADSYVFERSL